MTFHNPDYIRAVVADRERAIQHALLIRGAFSKPDDNHHVELARWARRRRRQPLRALFSRRGATAVD